MQIWNANQTLPADPEHLIYDINNCVLLRSDIHGTFVCPSFIFVPKAGKYLVHFFSQTVNHGPLYHNCMVENLEVPVQFLFARFAWAMFHLLHGFVAGPKRTADEQDVVEV